MLRENFRQLIVKGMHVSKDVKLILLDKNEDSHSHSHGHSLAIETNINYDASFPILNHEANGTFSEQKSSNHLFIPNEISGSDPYEHKKKKKTKRNIKKGTTIEESKEVDWGDDDYGFGKDAHR